MSEGPTEGERFYCRAIRLDDWPAISRLNRLQGGDQIYRTVLEQSPAFDGAVCMAHRNGPVIGWVGYLNSYRAIKKAPADGFLLLFMTSHPEWHTVDVVRALVDHLKAVAKLAGVPRVFSIVPDSRPEMLDVLFKCGMLLERDVAENGDPIVRMSHEVEAA